MTDTSPHDGSESALRRVMADFETPLKRYVRCLVNNSDDVDDIVHDTFVLYWRQISVKKRVIDNVKPFLYKVARNRAIDLLRKNRVKSLFSLQSQSGSINFETPRDELLSSEAESTLLDALNRLDPKDKDIIALIYVEGLKMHEAAEILSIGDEAVSSRLRRARSKLRTLLPSSLFDDWSRQNE